MRSCFSFCVVLGLSLVMAQTLADEPKRPCSGCGDDEKNEQTKSDPKLRTIYLCPLWIVDEYEEEQYLYYCNKYTPDCNATPVVDYYLGNTSWPCTCGPCCPHNFAADGKRTGRYAGYSGRPLPGEKINGPAGRFCDILVDPKVQYIQRKGTEEYAQLFVHYLNVSKALGDTEHQQIERIGVAWEMEKPTAEGVTIQELEWEPLDGNDGKVFRSKYEPANGTPLPILILKKKR